MLLPLLIILVMRSVAHQGLLLLLLLLSPVHSLQQPAAHRQVVSVVGSVRHVPLCTPLMTQTPTAPPG